MEEQQKLRIKTSMIVYALEQSLGNYVLQNEALKDNIDERNKSFIIDREKGKGNVIKEDNIALLIESSYLNEIFDFAIDLTKDTSLNEYMRELKNFCSVLGIFEIRNAVSHPNRPFLDCYWFRVAAIASDPLVEKLDLPLVKQALSSAIAENLNPPPDEWINTVKWAIPNTLPTTFDHEITGLLGREKEFKDLKNVLSKVRNNLIAVVAPGGIGKTALILQFFKDLTLTPEWRGKIDAISFCSLKNERLTADGIEVIEAINGIDQIKESILKDLKLLYNDKNFTSFDEACEILEDEKILICIDNLETLLMHSQEKFILFNQALPLKWRVVVTSRISIDSATTVPLEPLVKRHAVNLSRNYFRKRGVSNFNLHDLEKIADMANNNPLAIRLTIDLYIKDVDISKSIEKSQKDIALFSYKNLIESLKETSISVLEAIYAIGDSTKSELMELLQFSSEEIVESINELAKTSLIIRSTNDFGTDCYKLSDSIKDLLLINPKNIDVRTRISDSIKKRKSKILEQTARDQQLGVTEFDEQFIEKNTDQSTHVIIVDLNKFISLPYVKKNHKELIDIKSRFEALLSHNPHSYQLHFHYARVLRFLKDKAATINYLQKADKLKANSPRITLALALHFFYEGEYESAEIEFRKLIASKYNRPENSTKKFSFSITNCYLHSLLYLGRYDEIISYTKDWESDPDWFVLYGTHRASSFKRSIELRTSTNSKEAEENILKALEIFEKIFDREAYQEVACTEAFKLIKQIDQILQGQDLYSNKFKIKCLSFIANHFFGLSGLLRNVNIDSNDVQELLSRFYNFPIEKNPMQYVKWYKPTKTVYDKEHIEELTLNGYTIVEIYHIPNNEYGMSNYLFAKDNKENQYYLKVDCFEGGWNRWGYLDLQKKLAIKYVPSKQEDKPSPATEILEIDQFEV